MTEMPVPDRDLPPRDGIAAPDAFRVGAARAPQHALAEGLRPTVRAMLPCTGRTKRISGTDLAGLLADHAQWRDLCDQLENFADGLPGHPPLDARRRLADRIESATVAHIKITSSFLRRFFNDSEASTTRSILSRILSRQISDALHAEDTADILRSRSLNSSSIDMLSYMLRILFEGGRRALEFEGLFLLSLGSTRLTRTALDELERALA